MVFRTNLSWIMSEIQSTSHMNESITNLKKTIDHHNQSTNSWVLSIKNWASLPLHRKLTEANERRPKQNFQESMTPGSMATPESALVAYYIPTCEFRFSQVPSVSPKRKARFHRRHRKNIVTAHSSPSFLTRFWSK